MKERPIVREIEIRGNDDIDKDDIEGVISTKTKHVLNFNTLTADTEAVRKLYHEKAYLNVEVAYEVQELGENGVRVTFDIKENKKLYIKAIDFKGLTAFTPEDLREIMETNTWSIFHFFTDSGILNETKLQEDVNKLTAFYHNHGYINAQVSEPEINHDKEWIYLTIPITEGKQFQVGAVTITGDMLSVPRSELLEKLNIDKKNYFDREAVMKDIDFLTEACNNEGYAYAQVIPETKPVEDEYKVTVTYLIDKGKLIYINRINIFGNTKTRDKVIRRELSLAEGDLANRAKMKQSYMSLMRLRYFEEIDIQTEKGPDDKQMDVNIFIKEKSTGMFSIGAGYSAQENMLFMTQISQQNLFGRGQILSLNAYFGSKTTNYELSFVEPWLFDIPLWTRLEAWNTKREYDSYYLDTMGAGITFGYPLWEYIKGYITYRYADDDVTDVSETASKYVKEQAGRTTSSGVTLTLTRDTTDDIMFPSRGSKNSISVEHTGTVFQGDTSFTKYNFSSAWFFPLPFDNVFGMRGRIGLIQGNEGKEVPVYERFYLGGISSLRGLREIGPVDDAGDVIGGKTMLNFNFELIFPLIKNAGMKGVFFFDTGNAWESGYDMNDLRKTAGAGVRWYSPIGPLRLEWGYVLDRKENEPSNRWEFTIGMFM